MDSKPRLRPALFLLTFLHPTTTAVKNQEKILLLKCTENGELTDLASIFAIEVLGAHFNFLGGSSDSYLIILVHY